MIKKSVKKRIRLTKTGKIMRRKMGASHFRVKKSSSQKHERRQTVHVKQADRKAVVKYLGKK